MKKNIISRACILASLFLGMHGKNVMGTTAGTAFSAVVFIPLAPIGGKAVHLCVKSYNKNKTEKRLNDIKPPLTYGELCKRIYFLLNNSKPWEDSEQHDGYKQCVEFRETLEGILNSILTAKKNNMTNNMLKSDRDQYREQFKNLKVKPFEGILQNAYLANLDLEYIKKIL